jgi:hypothetical protein
MCVRTAKEVRIKQSRIWAVGLFKDSLHRHTAGDHEKMAPTCRTCEELKRKPESVSAQRVP